MYRTMTPIEVGSYLSHILTSLVNSFVGYEMSSLRGALADAPANERSGVVSSERRRCPRARRTRIPVNDETDEEGCGPDRSSRLWSQVLLGSFRDGKGDVSARDELAFGHCEAVRDLVKALEVRVRELDRLDVFELHDELSDPRLDRARPVSSDVKTRHLALARTTAHH